MARREPTGPRRPRNREPRGRLLIVCGSDKTEEQYLRGVRDRSGNRAVDVTMVNRPKDPLDVVSYAAKYLTNSKQDFDEVWCVFDVDDFDTGPACAFAAAESFEVAVSNPCFEFWLLLHHEDHRGHLNACSGALARLKRHLPNYDKTRLRFSDFADGVVVAGERAKKIEESGDTPRANPSSDVWRLVRTIEGGKDEQAHDGQR